MSMHPCPNKHEGCPLYNSASGCYADLHHQYWPKSEYRTDLEKRFRNAFVELMCRSEHNEIHHHRKPEKPSVYEMRQILEDYYGE